MNDKTLDQYLRKLSLREKELKEAKKENCSIEKLKNEREKAAFDMDFSRFEKGKVHPNFVIFPHVRFVPVPMHSHNYVAERVNTMVMVMLKPHQIWWPVA